MAQRWFVLFSKRLLRMRAPTEVLADQRGLAVIELAMTLPVLTMLSIGAFDVSRMIATQIDYQQAAAEVASLAIARPPQSDTAYLKTAAAAASGLNEADITVTTKITCNGVDSNANCASGQEQARYVTLTMNGQYVPVWTHFGIDDTVNLTVTRVVRYQ